ncbi:hypothetical protein M758_10G093500 [Ceratodon purpureus]|nr:hypothetical protein M758_10G093500 [Ceratodon purpureus]
MASFGGCLTIATLVLLSMVAGSQGNNALANQFTTWTPKNCEFTPDGRGVDLIVRNQSMPYASMTSKNWFMYGGIGAWIKLIPNNSAGTVTTFYLSSTGPKHCEFDFEFLGNVSGQPYVLHSNIFVDGIGGREQQIFLWFDPTTDYHYYNFQWNKDLLVFYVDNTPIRMFRNLEGIVPGFLYPKACPMALYLSVWDGSKWATQNGRVKIDWTAVPFVASYKNFRLNGCLANQGDTPAIAACQNTKWAAPGPRSQTIGGTRTRKLREIKNNYVRYNYCDDLKRWNYTIPGECNYNVL